MGKLARLAAAAVVAGALGGVALAGATKASAVTTCKTVRVVVHGHKLVWRWEIRHAKRVRVRVRVRTTKIEKKKECATSATAISSPPRSTSNPIPTPTPAGPMTTQPAPTTTAPTTTLAPTTAEAPPTAVIVGMPTVSYGTAHGAPFRPEGVQVTVGADSGGLPTTIPDGTLSCSVNGTLEGVLPISGYASETLFTSAPNRAPYFWQCQPPESGTYPVTVTYASNDGTISSSSGAVPVLFPEQYDVDPGGTAWDATPSPSLFLAPDIITWDQLAPPAGWTIDYTVTLLDPTNSTTLGSFSDDGVAAPGSCTVGPGSADTCGPADGSAVLAGASGDNLSIEAALVVGGAVVSTTVFGQTLP